MTRNPMKTAVELAFHKVALSFVSNIIDSLSFLASVLVRRVHQEAEMPTQGGSTKGVEVED